MQACGKSTFYKERFFDTHIRINLDMLKTRHREKVLFETCLAAKQPVVIDNTNPTPDDRQHYVEPAKVHGFRVIGYYFQSKIEDCKIRNQQRPSDQVVPLPGLLGTYSKLTQPTLAEGFDQLYYVKIGLEGKFIVEEWSDEV
jgi:predicted kinase